jgi:hypothetical protein
VRLLTRGGKDFYLSNYWLDVPVHLNSDGNSRRLLRRTQYFVMRAKSKDVTASILIASTAGSRLFRRLLQRIKAGQGTSFWRYLAATRVALTPMGRT